MAPDVVDGRFFGTVLNQHEDLFNRIEIEGLFRQEVMDAGLHSSIHRESQIQ
jgi:hypothetical protein